MKLLATCNCLQQVEREIPAEIQVQGKILTSQDGRKYACTGNIGSLLRNERLQGRELPYSCYGATLWNFVVGISLSYACGLEHVGVKPSQQGRALISHLLDTPSVMAWEEGCVFQSLIGRWCAYFRKFAFCCSWSDISQRTTSHFERSTYACTMGSPWALIFTCLVSRLWSQIVDVEEFRQWAICTVLVILCGIFWRRSYEGTRA